MKTGGGGGGHIDALSLEKTTLKKPSLLGLTRLTQRYHAPPN